MTDREKVIKGLECIAQKQEQKGFPCKDCGYISRPNFAICVKDVASDAIDLLKEQVPVKPISRFNKLLNETIYWCGKCETHIEKNQSYCGSCGKAVKWE